MKNEYSTPDYYWERGTMGICLSICDAKYTDTNDGERRIPIVGSQPTHYHEALIYLQPPILTILHSKIIYYLESLYQVILETMHVFLIYYKNNTGIKNTLQVYITHVLHFNIF